jgi:hypothetical protein
MNEIKEYNTVISNNLFIEPLLSDKSIGGTIEIFKNALPNALKIIQQIEFVANSSEFELNWEQAGIGNVVGRVNKNVRSNKNLRISDMAYGADCLPLQKIHNEFYMLLLRATSFYVQKYDFYEQLFHESYMALRYQTGEEYKAHYDGNSTTGRALSAIAYLNDEYEGGELEFPNYKIKIKPEQGDLILFPSNYAYAHIAHPVTSGTKYAIVTWLHDRPIES